MEIEGNTIVDGNLFLKELKKFFLHFLFYIPFSLAKIYKNPPVQVNPQQAVRRPDRCGRCGGLGNRHTGCIAPIPAVVNPHNEENEVIIPVAALLVLDAPYRGRRRK